MGRRCLHHLASAISKRCLFHLIKQELEVGAAIVSEFCRQILIVSVFNYKLNLLEGTTMQLEHLAEADGSIEGARDEVSDAGVPLSLISVTMLELQFTEESQ